MAYFILISIFLFTTIIFSILGIKSKFFILKNKVASSKQFLINCALIFIWLIITLTFIEGTFDTFEINENIEGSLKETINSIILLFATFYATVQMLKQMNGSGQADELNQLLNPMNLFFPKHALKHNLMLINFVDTNKNAPLSNDLKKIGLLKDKLSKMNNYDLYALSTYLKVVLTKEKLFFNGFTLAFITLIGGYFLNKTTVISGFFGIGFFVVVAITISMILFYTNIVNKNLFLLSIVVEDVIREKE